MWKKLIKSLLGSSVSFILSYWKEILIAGVAGYISFYFTSNHYVAKIKTKVEDARLEEQTKCALEKAITNETEKELQEDFDRELAKRDAIINRLRKEQPHVVARTAPQDDGKTGSELSGSVGGRTVAIDAERVTQLFFSADQIASKLLACQKFICKVYDANGKKLEFPVCHS